MVGCVWLVLQASCHYLALQPNSSEQETVFGLVLDTSCQVLWKPKISACMSTCQVISRGLWRYFTVANIFTGTCVTSSVNCTVSWTAITRWTAFFSYSGMYLVPATCSHSHVCLWVPIFLWKPAFPWVPVFFFYWVPTFLLVQVLFFEYPFPREVMKLTPVWRPYLRMVGGPTLHKRANASKNRPW